MPVNDNRAQIEKACIPASKEAEYSLRSLEKQGYSIFFSHLGWKVEKDGATIGSEGAYQCTGASSEAEVVAATAYMNEAIAAAEAHAG